MTIEKIREEMTEQKGKVLSFKFNGARNQIEEFTGKVVSTYPSVFLVRLQDETNLIKSFTYTDILMESLEIITK